MIYQIKPCPKPRMTRRDKYLGKPGRDPMRPEVARYWAFRDEVGYRMKEVNLDESKVIFFVPMPPSWSAKKRAEMLGQPHRQKPDLDNFIKGLGDALHADDAHVATVWAAKRWAEEGAISIEPLENML